MASSVAYGLSRCRMLATRSWTRSLPCAVVSRRCMSESAGNDADAMRRAASSAAANIEAGADELVRAYGREGGNTQAAVLTWMTDYYKHKEHKYTVPALSLLLEDERQFQAPSLVVKNATFFSTVLRNLPPDVAAHYCASLTLVPGLQMELLLAIVHGTGTPVSKAVFDRLGASIRRSGQRELISAAQLVSTVPAVPAELWPSPIDENSGMGAGAWASGDAWRRPSCGIPYPWERLPSFMSLREDRAVTFHDWLLLSATSHLECQWASFYASGSRHALGNIITTAVQWSEFSRTVPEPVALISDVSRSLPEELTGPGKAPGATPAEAVRAVKAVVSRAAVWSLMTFARRHAAVGEEVARACVPLGRWLVDTDARASEVEAHKAGQGELSPMEAPIASETEAKKRLDVLPGLLHLMASIRG